MDIVYNFIITNYTWILIIVIIILLSIIGSYADKTNFGEGNKNQIDEPEEEIDLSKKKLGDLVPSNNIKEKEEQSPSENLNYQIATQSEEIKNNITEKILTDNEQNNNEAVTKAQNIEDKLSKLDSEINLILPSEEEKLDTDILEELDDLSFDTKFDFKSKNSDSLFDDLELPKIRALKDEPDDIWNFKY